MAKQINLGKVKGTDATINGVSTLTITGDNGIDVSQSGSTLTLSAPTFANHSSNVSNPHNVTKSQVGLGNVDNKSEATIIADTKAAFTASDIENILGYTPADEENVAANITVDSTLSEGSTNPVQAGAVATALAGKQNVLSGTDGQFVGFDANGNAVAKTFTSENITVDVTRETIIQSLGYTPASVSGDGQIAIDSAFVANSTNAVESQVIKAALDAKQDAITGTEGQILMFDANGDPVATDFVSEVVTTALATHLVTINFSGPNDGTFVAPAQMRQTVIEGDSYALTIPAVAGYTPSQNVVSGTMETSNVTVNVTYTASSGNLIVTYVGPNGDSNFNTPAQYSATVAVGDTYSVPSPTVNGYTPDQATVTGTMTSAGVAVTVTYTRDTANLTINYVGPNDGFTAPSQYTATVNVGDSYSVASPAVTNYTPDQATVTGVMGANGATITVTYTRDTATLSITYTGPNDGNFSAPQAVSQTVNVGDTFSVASPAVSTYTPDIATVSGTMTSSGYSATVTYTRDKATLTVTYTGPNDGTFSAPTTVTQQVTIGETYTVTTPAVTGYVADKASVTGTMVAGGVSVTVTYEAEAQVYGFEIVTNESAPASKIRYIGANASFTPFTMNLSTGVPNYGDWGDAWFIKNIKPRLMGTDGTVLEELNPSDYSKKTDGSASSIASHATGNVMIGIPTVWIKYESGTNPRYYFASSQVDSSYKAYAHTNANGEVVPYIYIAAYNGYEQNSTLRSLSGKVPTRSETGTVQVTNAKKNNPSGKNDWNISVLSDRQLINLLLLLIGKSTNTQAVFGNGNMNGYSNKASGSDTNGVISTGTMNANGLFYGRSADNLGVKVFGIENWWGNIYDRTAGLIATGTTMKAKMTYGTEDGSTTTGYNEDGSGYITIGTAPSSGYITAMHYTQYGLFPSAASSGSDSTYYADYVYTSASGTFYALFGGDSTYGAGDGAFYCYLINAVSYSYWSYGARLSFKPSA